MFALFIIACNKHNHQSIVFANESTLLDLTSTNLQTAAIKVCIPCSSLTQKKITQLVIELPNNPQQERIKTLKNVSIYQLDFFSSENHYYCITYEITQPNPHQQFIKEIAHTMNNKLMGISHGIDLIALQNTTNNQELLDELKKALKTLHHLSKQLREHYGKS